MEKLNIAFLTHNLGQGGAERQLFHIIKTLIEQGCYPVVFTFSAKGYWQTSLATLGARVICINGHNKISRFRKLMQFFKQGDYDYIHAQQFGLNIYATAASLLCGGHSIGSIRSNGIYDIKSVGIMGWLSLMLPAKIVANSKLGIENARKFCRNPKSLYFLPNVVDTNVFSPGETKKTEGVFKVITVGTIWKPKRIDRVIEIAGLLGQRLAKKVVFEIIGDGEELVQMVALAKSKGILNSSVFFKGRTDNIALEYKKADALLLTSDFEGTPNVVLEAMSSGLPVIASNVGGIPEIIVDGQTGFCVERENVKKMAEIIEALSQDAVLCSSIGKQARNFILSNHSPVILVDKLVGLYVLG